MHTEKLTREHVEDPALRLAEQNTILRCIVGSAAFGLETEESGSDRDEMGVVVETPEQALGLGGFEQIIRRTAEQRDGQGARSKAGDLDLVLYGLRKFLRLALGGNPTILTLLFVPDSHTVKVTMLGRELRNLAPAIVSRKAGGAFLGYLVAQRMRLTGERGQKDVKRPELVAKYGHDTKYATHALRLGFQGIELMRTGTMTLPMPEPERSYLLGVRRGEVSLQEVLTKSGELERELRDLGDGGSPLPPLPNQPLVEEWLVDTIQYVWQGGVL